MAIELPAGLAELLGQIQSGVRTGFQRSHSIGTAFHRKLSGWLDNIDFNVDADFNLSPRPETQRGSATIGVAAHNGNHVGLIDELKYDAGDVDGVSRKFLNVIERKQRDELVLANQRNAPAAEIEAIKAAITALGHAAGTEWRVEEIGFNAHAELPGSQIGVRFTDGQVVDYSVEGTGDSRRAAAADNDNGAWPEQTFCFAGGRAA